MNELFLRNLKIDIYGGSHDPEIGVHADGFPAGETVDMAELQAFLARRAPGSTKYGTQRKEADLPHFLSGVDDGVLSGEMLEAVIYNTNMRSGDYPAIPDVPRPSHADFAAIQKYGDGVDLLLPELKPFMPEGPQLFEEGMVSDQPERQMIAEIIREKMLHLLAREVPHGVAVVIERFSERDNEIIDVEAVIYCERESHKGIIIGKRGAMLKAIGEQARVDIEEFMGTKVYLQTWVKVKENWRDNVAMIRNFSYE